MNAKISMSFTCDEAIIYSSLYNLHNRTFKIHFDQTRLIFTVITVLTKR